MAGPGLPGADAEASAVEDAGPVDAEPEVVAGVAEVEAEAALDTGGYEEAVARVQALPGWGPWTAQYWALRALRDADAFPESDVGLLRSPAVANGNGRLSPKALLARAENWRPWRAYAAQHLWTDDGIRAHG